MPEISAEKISYVITKARELANGDGKPEAGRAGPSGRGAVKVGGAPCAKAQAELAIFNEAMAEDEQCELVALAWIGRGVFTREEWASAVVEAHAHRPSAAEYLLRNPKMLAPHLEHGLAEFDESGEGFGGDRQ